MNDEIAKQINALDTRRAEILYAICENERIYLPEIILSLVQEVRSITRILKVLRHS